MRVIRDYKKLIASATLFPMIVGLFLLCNGLSPLPALASNHTEHSTEEMIDDCPETLKTINHKTETLANNSESLPMEANHDNHLSPCCHEKTEPTQKTGIENTLSYSLISLASWPINFSKTHTSATLRSFAQDPPKSLDSSIKEIVKQE